MRCQKSIEILLRAKTQKPAQLANGEMMELVFLERQRFQRAAREISAGGLEPLGEFIGYMKGHVHAVILLPLILSCAA
jgi:hypothetical protein